ncbi:MAG: hypothetical protein ACT4OJ_07055 [Bacteroidota bacterium]
MEGVVLYGLVFLAGLFVCITIVSVLEINKIITIRYPSEYFFIAVIIEIALTLFIIKI